MRLAKLGLLACLLSGVAHAESKFSFANTPGQLPKTVVPQDYKIQLTPDLKTFTFKGSETIRVRVERSTQTMTLNALDMTVQKAGLVGGPEAQINLNPEKQTLTLRFPKMLRPGSYTLALAFAGKIGPRAEGLYHDRYPTAQGEKVLLATQMESTDARRMFPSWDEPVYRATYQLTVTVPKKFTAVSNMPITREEVVDPEHKRVSFGRTPSMASYLVVLVAGELEFIEGEADGVKIRIFTTEGKKEKARYALASAQKILHYYNDYFGVKYPLPKLDMMAVPGGFGGAMENWGGIVYNEAILLYDPKTSSESTKEAVFSVIAHEMAHQWFGDLVTMAWWDNLWLNEGFASWMGTKTEDHFNPQWETWLRANGEKDAAMGEDSLKTTHPIQQPVRNESEAADAFDDITYLKGQSFLRMLETYLGEATFRQGIRQYMKDHQYSSTTTADLWEALAKASGKPVAAIAAGWTEQPGFPVVQVTAQCQGNKQRLRLSQTPFTINNPNPTPRTWQIPVALQPFGGETTYALLGKSSRTVAAGDCGTPVKANAGNVGYYRVQYDPALAKKLLAQFRSLPPADRVNLLSDTWALVEAGRTPASTYLDLVSAIGPDTNLAVWEEVTGSLRNLDRLLIGSPIRPAFQAFARKLLNPVLAQVGWESKPKEGATTALLRRGLITTLGFYGDEAVKAEARQRFQAFLQNPQSLPGDLIGPVINTVGRYADQATYDQIHELGKKAEGTEEKDRYYRALTAAIDPQLAQQNLQLALTNELPPNRAARLVDGVAFGGEQPQLAWDFAQTHLKALLEKLPFFGRSSFVPNLLEAFPDRSRADELERFAQANLPVGDRMEVAKGAENIRFQAMFKDQALPVVQTWLQEHS